MAKQTKPIVGSKLVLLSETRRRRDTTSPLLEVGHVSLLLETPQQQRRPEVLQGQRLQFVACIRSRQRRPVVAMPVGTPKLE